VKNTDLKTQKKKEVGLIERYGSGIRRIVNICKDHGIIEPIFEEKPNGFMVTIFKEKLNEMDAPDNVTENVTDNVTENVTENRLAIILKEIEKNPKISYNELGKLFNITRMTVYRDIEKLKEEGKIKRIGPAKSGHWQIVNK